MARYNYDRLSAQDNEFLIWERPGLPMHIAGLQIFEAGPLLNEYGGIDFEKIKAMIEAILHKVPRYRQKLAWIPREDHAVWVDDPHFNPDFHIRHTSLPRPGTDVFLKKLMGRIMAQPLDRSKPLWELWVIEGLEGDRFATILKNHHCMIDGSSGVDLASRIFSLNPEYTIPEAPPYHPRPIPSGVDLWSDEWRRRIAQPLQAVDGIRSFLKDTADLGSDLARRSRAVGEVIGLKVAPASETPLNGPVGPHRVFDCMQMPLDDLKAVRRKLDCSINDLVLTIVTGAVRDYMSAHQVRPETLDFRVETPVNVRRASEEGKMGNRVSSWVVRLPLAERDPIRQVREIHRATQELRESGHADVVEMLHGLLDWFSFDIQSAAKGVMNMIVSNVPGPQFPLHLLGAELLEAYPVAPLLENLGLTLGVFSYNGNVHWGFIADYDRVPDVGNFVEAIRRSFARVAEAAEKEAVAKQAREIQAETSRKKVSRKKVRPKKAGGRAVVAKVSKKKAVARASGEGGKEEVTAMTVSEPAPKKQM